MNWPLRQLAECCQVITKGTTPTSFGMPFSDSGIPFLRVQNIQQGSVEFNGNTLFIDEQTHKTLERSRIQPDDVLLSIAGTIGRSAIVPDSAPVEMNCNQAVAIIRIQDYLDTRFLLRWLNTPNAISQMTGGMVTGTIANLSLTQVRNLKVPAPPLAEQRRIAEVLDRAEALRAKRRAALAQLDTLTQSLFLDLFGDTVSNPKGWPLVPLPTVIYFQEGPGVRNWQFRKEGIKLVNVGNIVDGRLLTENTERHLDPLEVEQRYKHFLLDAGDFVVASSGVTWGKIAEVEQRHLPLCLNTSMIRFRPLGGGVEKQFVRAFVESPAFRRQILRLITGSAQPNFGPAHLKQVRIPLPPIELQREFARRVSAVEKLKTAQRASLAELDALFATLHHRAFRGEL